jgi:hypothetical protein
VTLIGSGLSFLRSFVDDLPIYASAVRHHPPGLLLALWLLDWMHAQWTGWAVVTVLVAASAIAPAIVVIGGRRSRAAYAVAIALPALLWPAPEPAALFAAVMLVGVALLVRGRRAVTAVGAGLAFGAALLLTYVAAVVVLITCSVTFRRDRRRALVAGALAVGLLLLVAACGFSWPAGLQAAW